MPFDVAGRAEAAMVRIRVGRQHDRDARSARLCCRGGLTGRCSVCGNTGGRPRRLSVATPELLLPELGRGLIDFSTLGRRIELVDGLHSAALMSRADTLETHIEEARAVRAMIIHHK